jgi:hypothetical protein
MVGSCGEVRKLLPSHRDTKLSWCDCRTHSFNTGRNTGATSICTFDVNVTLPVGLAPGVYTNTTEEITATVDGATRTGEPVSDTLTVVGAPTLAKSFTDGPVMPGGTVTLEFTLSHPADAPGNATGIAFTDDLNAVLIGLAPTCRRRPIRRAGQDRPSPARLVILC